MSCEGAGVCQSAASVDNHTQKMKAVDLRRILEYVPLALDELVIFRLEVMLSHTRELWLEIPLGEPMALRAGNPGTDRTLTVFQAARKEN